MILVDGEKFDLLFNVGIIFKIDLIKVDLLILLKFLNVNFLLLVIVKVMGFNNGFLYLIDSFVIFNVF